MEYFSSLVGKIYDAAIDPTLWGDALRDIGVFLRCSQSVVAIEDIADPEGSAFHTSFEDDDWVASYRDYYMKINPMRLATVASVRTDDIVLTKDFMTSDEYANTPFAQEWCTRRDIVDIAVAGQLLEQRTLERHNFAAALDRLAAAVFLVDAEGTVLHANDAAARLLRDLGPASRARGQFWLPDRAAQAALTRAISEAAGDPAQIDPATIAMTMSDERKYVAAILPLGDGRRSDVRSNQRAVAAVCFKEVAPAAPIDERTLISLYGLTRKEAAIFAAAVEMGSVADIAEAMGLTQATAKTHLKSIYRKTGAMRRADLVRLMSGLIHPFVA